MAAAALPPVELSSQPLSLSFWSSLSSASASASAAGRKGGEGARHFLACGLTDGTVEVHDITGLLSKSKVKRTNCRRRGGDGGGDEEDEDEEGGDGGKDDVDDDEDTIVASVSVHSSEIPSHSSSSLPSPSPGKGGATGGGGSGRALRGPSCRAVLFSDERRDGDSSAGGSSSPGAVLYTAGNGGGLAAFDASRLCSPSRYDDEIQPLWYIPDAHSRGGAAAESGGRDAGINRLHRLPVGCPAGPALLASGDDAGRVRLWDARMCGGVGGGGVSSAKKKRSRGGGAAGGSGGGGGLGSLPRGCVAEWSHHTDYISGFDSSLDDGTTLLVSSADCTLSVLDLRRAGSKNVRDLPPHPARARTAARTMPGENGADPTLLGRSDNQEDELLSVCALKRGRKVLCGSAEGVLSVWSYGTWGDCSDRFPGHPASIDALLKVDENTVLTGCSDGLIRAVSIQPDRLLGVLGNCGGLPVEAMALGAWKGGGVGGVGGDGGRPGVIGAIGHDDVVRLWDAGVLFDDDDGDSDDDERDSEDDEKERDTRQNSSKVTAAPAVPLAASAGSADEWEDEDDSEDEDSNDDKPRGKKRPKGGQDKSDDSDSDDSDTDSDDSGNGGGWEGGGVSGRPKLKTEAERFFEDL